MKNDILIKFRTQMYPNYEELTIKTIYALN